jgi:hypothetical protein
MVKHGGSPSSSEVSDFVALPFWHKHVCVTPNKKLAIGGGFGLVLQLGLDAENRSPAFERFIFSCFPTDKLRGNLDTRFQVEAQGSFVIENDFDNVVIGRN